MANTNIKIFYKKRIMKKIDLVAVIILIILAFTYGYIPYGESILMGIIFLYSLYVCLTVFKSKR